MVDNYYLLKYENSTLIKFSLKVPYSDPFTLTTATKYVNIMIKLICATMRPDHFFKLSMVELTSTGTCHLDRHNTVLPKIL